MRNNKTYSIGEASAMTGISQRQLRRWASNPSSMRKGGNKTKAQPPRTAPEVGAMLRLHKVADIRRLGTPWTA